MLVNGRHLFFLAFFVGLRDGFAILDLVKCVIVVCVWVYHFNTTANLLLLYMKIINFNHQIAHNLIYQYNRTYNTQCNNATMKQ